jgi:hypothetical protein
MENKVNLVNFNLEKDGDICGLISSRFENDDRVDLQEVRFYKEVAQLLRDSGNGVLFFKIESKPEFVQALAILKSNIHLIEKGLIRPACLLGVKSKKVEKLLYKYGCRDILDININPKTLLIKTEMWIRTLVNQINSSEDCFMSLGQRSQDIDATNEDYSFKTLPEADFAEDEDELEEEMELLVDEIESDEEDDEILALDSLIDELGEGEIKEDLREVPELRLVTSEESSPELVDFIQENGEVGKLNLETGYLGLVLGDENNQQSCVFESFEETNMILEVSDGYEGEVGDPLNVFVKFIYNKCKVEIELSGRISEVESFDDGRKHVSVDFDVAEVERYDYFMSLYQKRQKSINDFMELARGF